MNYEQDHSHYHCWDQKTPACGIPKDKHTRCCLCEKKAPLICTVCKKPIEDKVSGGSLSLDPVMRGPWHVGCHPVKLTEIET